MGNLPLRELFYQHEGRLIHKWDHYFEIYEKHFSKYRGQKVLNILEIGISHGGSIQLWRKYFGNHVHIYAIDINPECEQFADENTTIFIGSQSDPEFLNQVLGQLPDLDIIIDDGGHTMVQQKVSFEMLYSKVREGGIYLVEDTHTSYWREFHGGLRNSGSFVEYSKNMIDSLYNDHVEDRRKLLINDITRHINSITFYDSIIVFEKLKRKNAFHIRIGEETIKSYVPVEMKKRSFFMKLKSGILGKKRHSFDLNDKGKI